MKKAQKRQSILSISFALAIVLVFVVVLITDKTPETQGSQTGSVMREPNYDYKKIITDDWGFKVMDAGNGIKQSWKGIDISSHQKDIDWARLAQVELDFIILRLGYRGNSEGGLVKDEKFDEYYTGAKSIGLPIGVYFVTQAISADEAVEEAEYVIAKLQGLDITWPVVLDVEAGARTARARNNSKKQNTDFIKMFCEKIEAAGYTAMVYSNNSYFTSKIDTDSLKDYALWYASYGTEPAVPWDFAIWQYSDKGIVPGITKEVDLDISFVNYGGVTD